MAKKDDDDVENWKAALLAAVLFFAAGAYPLVFDADTPTVLFFGLGVVWLLIALWQRGRAQR